MAADDMRWQLIAMGAAFDVLVGVYVGLPLSDVGGLKTEPPMLAAGYASFIKSVIFSIQGLATLLPWLLDITASRTRFCIDRIWWLWICTWAAESGFTVTHYIMQTKYPGEMPVAGFSVALLALLIGFVSMSLALRRLVLAQADRARPTSDDPSVPYWQWACVGILYLTPTTIYAAWLCFASCLSAIQLATALGVSYDARTTASIVLLVIVSLTTLTQPWILRPQIIFRPQSKVYATEPEEQHQQEAEKRKRFIQGAHWGAFLLASTFYAYTILDAMSNDTEETRPPALQAAWDWLPVPLPLLPLIGAAVRHYLLRQFPATAVGGLHHANVLSGNNVVVYVRDEVTQEASTTSQADVSVPLLAEHA